MSKKEGKRRRSSFFARIFGGGKKKDEKETEQPVLEVKGKEKEEGRGKEDDVGEGDERLDKTVVQREEKENAGRMKQREVSSGPIEASEGKIDVEVACAEKRVDDEEKAVGNENVDEIAEGPEEIAQKMSRHRVSSSSFHLEAPRPHHHQLSKHASEGHLLHEAFVGDQSAVKRLLLTDVDVNCKDKECHSTPLHHAAKSGHIHVVETLIRHGANVNAKDDEGETPLHEACDAGKIHVVEILIKNGANVNEKDKLGWTPLHNAAGCEDYPEIVSVLLKAGAKLKATNNDYETAETVALKNSHPLSHKILLEYGCGRAVEGSAPGP
eukprot:g2107.t1